MDELASAALILAAVVVALVEAAKRMGLPSRYAPGVAIACGVGIAALASWGNVVGGFEGNPARVILGGILAGLAASGLYSGVKKTARG